MKTARVYLPKERLYESSGSYVKPAKNLFRSPATYKGYKKDIAPENPDSIGVFAV